MQRPKLTPVVHKTLNGLHRVALSEEDGEYQLQVDDHYVRRYDANTLPDEIKVRLAMIKAVPMLEVFTDEELYFNSFRFYENNHSKNLDDVGWRVTKNLYCLVLPSTLLNKLKGER